MTHAPKSELLEMSRTLINRSVDKAEFLEVINDYYSDEEYHQIEADGRIYKSKKELVEDLSKRISKITKYLGGKVGAISVASDDGKGNGVTMAEYKFSAEFADGSKGGFDQVQVITWKNNKIVKSHYYYNPG